MAKHLESCVDEIAQFRANMTMLREAILADHGELSELEDSRPGRDHPDYQVHEDRINAIKRRLADRHVL